MTIGIVRDPNSGEVYADVTDLIAFLKDAQEHPDKYDKQAVTRLAEEAMGKKREPTMERPF